MNYKMSTLTMFYRVEGRIRPHQTHLGKPKVANLKVSLMGEEYVRAFQIAVQDVVAAVTYPIRSGGIVASGDLFSKRIAIGHLKSAGGEIASGDLFSKCVAIGDLKSADGTFASGDLYCAPWRAQSRRFEGLLDG